MKSKGALISFLVFVILLGFLPIEKASASVSSNPLNELADRIDTSKNYYIVPADLPTRGLSSRPSLNFSPSLVVSSLGNTVEKPSEARMKLVFSEEKKTYHIGMPYPMPGIGLVDQFIGSSLHLILGEQYAADWTITPVEGGYILQAEGGYLDYKDGESPLYGPLTFARLGKEKVVWKLVPAS
ncbi:hypothetical protein [Bacillus cereus group sp. IBL03679]|uniref:hypothetical protein n=1 Tax=Bacillus cereus group sp. IBL03679 TaxID=3240095 RepID=UPI003D2F56BA